MSFILAQLLIKAKIAVIISRRIEIINPNQILVKQKNHTRNTLSVVFLYCFTVNFWHISKVVYTSKVYIILSSMNLIFKLLIIKHLR